MSLIFLSRRKMIFHVNHWVLLQWRVEIYSHLLYRIFLHTRCNVVVIALHLSHLFARSLSHRSNCLLTQLSDIGVTQPFPSTSMEAVCILGKPMGALQWEDSPKNQPIVRMNISICIIQFEP